MKLQQNYSNALRHIDDWHGYAFFFLMIAALIAAPFFLQGYIVYNLTLFLIYALVAVALMILVGFTGQVSLGHAGFLAAGAYSTAMLVQNGGPFLVGLLLSFIIAGILGLIIGVPSLRLEGPYLAIATLGFGLAIQQILNNWKWVGSSTGMLADRPDFLNIYFYDDKNYYFLVLIIVVVLIWMAFNLRRSHIGRAFLATRDAELAAQMSGINLSYYKTLAFVISAALTGLAGGLYGGLIGYITPESFNLILSVKFLLIIVIGGLGFLPGAIIGAFFITGLEVFLSAQANRSQLIFGVVVILIMMLEPYGIYGRWQKIKRYWRTWPM